MNKPQLLAGFAVKVLLGLLYGYIFLHYYNGDDTWKFFRASLKETELLLNDPGLFFKNEFTPANALQTGRNAGEVIMVYLEDLQYVLVVKVMAVMNLITRGNYYVNVALFNAIVFFGHYWMYQLMAQLFPAKKNLYYLLIFFFVPAVFWLSGIRVDGILFFFLSLLLFYLCGRHEKSFKRTMLIITGFAGVIICRPQVAVLTAIAAVGWYITTLIHKPMAGFGIVYCVAMILFFVPRSNISGKMAEKQIEFSRLKGTKFKLDDLDGSPAGYIRVLPQAAGNTFVRPLPWEAKGFLQLMASAEIVAFWMIIIASVVYRHEYWKLRLLQPVVLMMLILGISIYILVGYIVPFPGAIVRYKAIPELMILCSMISISRWSESTNYKKV